MTILPEKKCLQTPRLTADQVLNLNGLPCPQSEIIMTRVLAEIGTDKILEIIVSDMSTKHTIRQLCKKNTCQLINIHEEKGIVRFFVRK